MYKVSSNELQKGCASVWKYQRGTALHAAVKSYCRNPFPVVRSKETRRRAPQKEPHRGLLNRVNRMNGVKTPTCDTMPPYSEYSECHSKIALKNYSLHKLYLTRLLCGGFCAASLRVLSVWPCAPVGVHTEHTHRRLTLLFLEL